MIKLLLLAADWLVSLKIYSFGGKISLTLLQSAWPLRLVNVFLKLRRVLHRPLTLFFRGLVGGTRTSTQGEGGEKMQTNFKKEEKKNKQRKLGDLSRTPSPRPLKSPKAIKNCLGSALSGFSARCLLFSFSEADPSEALGDSGSGSFPGHLAGWRRPKGLRSPRALPSTARLRGPRGSGAAGLLAQCARVGAGVDGSYRLQREDGGVRVLRELSVSLWLGLPLYNGIKFKFKCGRDV